MGKGGESAVHSATCKQLKSSTSSVVSEDTNGQHWISPYNPLDPNAPKLPTKGEIKAVIPKECFVRSYVHSMYFVVRDTVMALACVYVAYHTLSTNLPSSGLLSLDGLLWCTGWNIYAFWMGCVLTGHWVLAHECGHGAFSPNQTFNDICGFIMHQAVLVPYFAWQFTHAKHHRRTNNTVDGESHVPGTKDEVGLNALNQREHTYAIIHEAIGDGPFGMLQIFAHLVIGWPLYLLGLASTGRLGQDGKPLESAVADHYRPWSKMFPSKMRIKIAISTLGVIATWVGLAYAAKEYGILSVSLWYLGPLMWNQAWLVLYTWLQHNDPTVPQYGPDEWTWVRGALSTIDRPYGIFDFFHHKIGSTHVAHHLFHEMPFYKADVATAAIKAYLEPMGLYNYDPTPWYMAMWRIAKRCHYIEGLDGIQYYKSLEDIPLSKKGGIKKLD